MALARVQYEADGSTTEYSITFEYIERDHVQVSLDGDETTAWSFLDDSTIKFDSAPADGVIIDIVRQTEREVLLVEFNDGSTLLETDLTLAALQSFYLAQESFDQTGSTLTVANDGSYSASGRRISQLEYPNSSDDATNRQYVDDVFADGENAADMALEAQHWANYPEDDLVPEGDGVDDYSALHHRNKADDAQAASELARDEAQLWAEEDEDVEVETGAYSSKHHSIKSSDSASAAATSESNAATSESNAATSESNAAASETNAADSESKAQLWAEEAEDVEVEAGEYSAYHWSKKAEGWAAGVNMPSADGNGGKLIRQAADESGFEYITASEGRTLLDVYPTSSVYTKTESDNTFEPIGEAQSVMDSHIGSYDHDGEYIRKDSANDALHLHISNNNGDYSASSTHSGNRDHSHLTFESGNNYAALKLDYAENSRDLWLKVGHTTDTFWDAAGNFRVDLQGGSAILHGGGSWGTSSDARYKEDVRPIEDAVDKLSDVRGVTYKYIGKDERSAGVIAQEVQEILPEVVNEDRDGTLNVNYGELASILIQAVKELDSRVKELESK